ncbi:MAG: hypothetical protein IPG46_01095 [Actinobacteria bacterium]|nr:hypothetical protein [Actinomycetota bacterium]
MKLSPIVVNGILPTLDGLDLPVEAAAEAAGVQLDAEDAAELQAASTSGASAAHQHRRSSWIARARTAP